MSRPYALVSVDLDPVDLHLSGYGLRGAPPDALVYERALPRLLSAFRETGVRATFFLVGRDAAARREAVASVAAAGHEVASHTMTHPMPLASLPEPRLRSELRDSRRVLGEASGAEVVGFRAPNWDISDRVLELLVEEGYRYDASSFPTLLQIPARALLAFKAGDPRAVLSMRPWPITLDPRPRLRRTRRGAIAIVPVSVTRGIGFPIYHTARYLLGDEPFVRALDSLSRRGSPLSYPLHGVDALGLREDGVDPRLARHPGMERSLASKLDLLAGSLKEIVRRFEPIAHRDFVERQAWS